MQKSSHENLSFDINKMNLIIDEKMQTMFHDFIEHFKLILWQKFIIFYFYYNNIIIINKEIEINCASFSCSQYVATRSSYNFIFSTEDKCHGLCFFH